MPKRFYAIAVLTLFLLVPCAVHFPLSAKEEADKQPAPGNPFSGKVLAIFTNELSETNSYVLEEARLKTIGNRQFLAGKSASTGDEDWTRELPISIAWDAIVSIIEFESIEQYKQRSKDVELRAAR